MSSRLWITWEHQRRNASLSEAVGATLFVFDVPWPGWIRYPLLLWRTMDLLLREKPRLVFVQNPSLVLAYAATRYGRIAGVKVVVDAHNAGIQPFDGRRRWATYLCRKVIADAALTIVSNGGLAPEVLSRGGRPFVIPDPLPTFPAPDKVHLRGPFNVLYICSWADDEPYAEVIKAASDLGGEACIYVTGNYRKRMGPEEVPALANLVLTGFVSEREFVGMLHAADVVVDLTTRQNCLVCGAYEAVAAGTPLILSNTAALREHFRDAALYADNTAADLVRAIRLAREKGEELRLRVARRAEEQRAGMRDILARFERELADPRGRTGRPA